jgi:membrane-bound lytic murein transglycosylase B
MGGNAANFISGGDWAPNSNAGAEQALREANEKAKKLKQEQDALDKQKQAEQDALNLKQLNRLKTLTGSGGLTPPAPNTSLLG